MATPIVGLINAKAYATIQAAVDAVASTGGSVFIPAGTYSATSVPAFTGVSIPDSVHVRGAGHGATILDLTGQSTSITAVSITGENASLQNIKIQGQGSSGSGYGVHIADTAGVIRGQLVADVVIDGTPSWAVVVGDAGADVVLPEIVRVHVSNCSSNGSCYLGPFSFAANVRQCNWEGAASSTTAVVQFDGCSQTHLTGGTIEPPNGSNVVGLRVSVNGSTYPRANKVTGAWMEFHDTTATAAMVELSGSGQVDGLVIQGCNMVRPIANKAPRPLKSVMTGGASIGIVFRDNIIQENGGGPYTDDINMGGSGQDEVLLSGNKVYDLSNATSHGLSTTGTNRAKLTRMSDNGRNQMGRDSWTGSGFASIPDPQTGEFMWDTAATVFCFYNGANWQKVTFTAR